MQSIKYLISRFSRVIIENVCKTWQKVLSLSSFKTFSVVHVKCLCVRLPAPPLTELPKKWHNLFKNVGFGV